MLFATTRRFLARPAALAASALLATSVVVIAPPLPAFAAAGITLGKSGPATVLAGAPAAYTLTAANPSANATAAPEYNLSFRDVLPVGTTYVGGSTTPASAGEPTIATNPATGQQTLVWRNVSDLQIGDSLVLGFSAATDPAVLPVGATFLNNASAYAHSDPRRIPAFSAAGVVTPGSYTESAAASSAPTTVSALEITKSEPSPESELLRGIHEHPTVYTLTVRSTGVAPSTGVVVTDYLPAGLELLGCGGVDNSAAREYVGAPSLTATPAVPGCRTPVSVTTVVDPPAQGSTVYPAGTYTRVQWNLGTLAAGATVTIPYAAGIPLRATTATFAGGAPSGASLGQIANLDNNTGASTRELVAESSLVNIARATGTYTGAVVSGGSTTSETDTRHTVSIEDVRMRKAASTTQFATLGRVQYTLTIDTGEYVSASGIVVTDTIPNGLCPFGAVDVNYVSGSPADCTSVAGTTPSSPITSATQNADGTFTVVFAPLATVGSSGTTTLTYWAGMRDTYTGGSTGGQPTASGDSFTNTASLVATTSPRPGTGETGTQTVTDTSSSTIDTRGLTIDKTIGPRSLGGQCGTDGTAYGEASSFPANETQFRKGDLICFKVRVDFDTLTRTRNPVVTDFVPVGTEYVAGTAVATTANVRAPSVLTESAQSLSWVIGDQIGSAKFADIGAVFEWVFAVRVTDAAPVGAPEILGNAMKLRAEDTAGRGRSYRDQVDFTVVPAVPIGVVKGIQTIDAPAAGPYGLNSNVDGLAVIEGSTVRFRVDLTNNGTAGGPDGYGAGAFDLWDVLPDNIRCAGVSNIVGIVSNPVTPTIRCTDPGDPAQPSFASNATHSAIRWTYTLDPSKPLAPQGILPGESWTYTYDMVIPLQTSAGFVFTNTASVSSYAALTNVDTSRPGAVATYFPQNNVDTTVPVVDQDAPPASDIASVVTPAVAVGKVGTTSITETNNNTAAQATIGELVTYRYAVTIPAGTTVFDGSLTDILPAGFVLVGVPAPTAELCPVAPTPTTGNPLPACPAPAALPAGVSLAPSTGALMITGVYDNVTGSAQRFLVTTTARVTGASLSTGQNAANRDNTARFVSTATLGGAALAPVTATYTVNVRQPNPTIIKTNDRPGLVVGGQVVTYTVSVLNQSSAASTANRPPAHDAFVVDCLPTGLTFAAYGANPGLLPVAGDGTNGCAVGSTRLVWRIGDVPPSLTAITRTYTATVDLTAVGGDAYTNTATLSSSTLDDAKPTFDAADNPTERVYSATSPSTVTIAGSALVKSVDEPLRTIGQTATYTVSALVPANTNFYDAALIDTVPTGLSAPVTVSAACIVVATSVPCGGVTITSLTPAPQAGGTKHGFLIGDILASPDVRRITIVYTSIVTDVPSNVAAAALTNTATSVWFATDGHNPTSAGDTWDRAGGSDSATVTVLEPALAITKTVDDTTPDPGQQFHYSVTVRNASGATVSPAFNVAVTDVVPLGVVVESTTAGGTITGADPVRGGGTITWSAADLAGPLAPGASYLLTYTAHLAPSTTLAAVSLVNTAKVVGYDGLPAGGRHYSGPISTANVTPQFPKLVTAKAATDGAPAYIGTPFTWTVTVSNTGGATAFAVSAVDTLPPGWTYDVSSARISVAGGPATAGEPVVVAAPGGDRLGWVSLADLAPGARVTVTYRATPGASVVTSPGVGSSVPHTNSATSAGLDATGATGNATGLYGGSTATAATHVDSADVRIVKSHGAAPVAGSPFGWSLTTSNLGPDPAVGSFTVTDIIAAPTTLVSAAGTGWTCATAAATITCHRTSPTDTLASGGSFPVVSVTVDVPAGVVDGTVLTNIADVSARTYDPDTANNTSTDTAAVTTRADLQITKSHSGAVVAGQDATYTLDVVNLGPSVSRGPITVVDALPAGSTFVSAAGTGWACVPGTGTVSCVRATDLGVGVSAPQITVVVAVPTSQTADVVNIATVSGTTTDPVPGNNTSTDRSAPGTSADVSIQKQSTGSIVAGTRGTYRLVVDNAGPSDAVAVRITDTLPAGLTFAGSHDVAGSWTCSAVLQVVTCTLSGTLAADPGQVVAGDAVVTIDVDVASSVTGPVVNTATVSSTTPDPNPGNNSDTDTSTFTAEADLVLVKSHPAPATAGAQFHWTLAVRNAGPSDSPGDIVVTDGLPAGTTFVSATGTGWSCTELSGQVTCTRTTTLVSGANAGDIDLVVVIDPSAGPATIINTATVDGPLTDPDLTNNTDSDVVVIGDRADISLTKTTTGANPVAAGGTTEFTIAVTNAGPSTADSVVVVDILPTGLVQVSASGDGWTCDPPAGQNVSCQRATLAPGTSSIVVIARVVSSVAEGTTLTNSATASTSTPGDNVSDNTDASTVDVIARADLVILKTHAAAYDTVAAGTQAVFHLDARNAGPSDAQPDITLVDSLPAGVTFVSTAGPWTCTAGAVTGTGQDITCVLDGGTTLVAGAAAPRLDITVAVAADAAVGPVTNSATVTSPTTDPNPTDNTDTDTIDVVHDADLSIVKAHTGPVRIGDLLTFTLAVANAGPTQATGVTVSDPLPAGLTYVSADGTGWTCAESAATVTCDLAAALAPGASAPPITVVVTVEVAAYPTADNVATVGSATPDSHPADNTSTDPVDVPALVDLTIAKSHQGVPQVGQRTIYSLVVANAGPTADPGPITVTDPLAAGLTFVSASGPGWVCSSVAPVVTCTRAAGLAVSESSTISLVVGVGPLAFPTVTNVATVTTPSEETQSDNNSADDTSSVAPLSELAVVKRLVRYDADSKLARWLITVTNNGPNPTQRPIVVSDVLVPGLMFASVTGSGWVCGAVRQTVTCQFAGSLVVGASAGFTLETAAQGSPGEVITNTATLAGNVDPVPANDTSSAQLVLPSGHGLSPTGSSAASLLLLGLLSLMLGGVALATSRRRPQRD